MAEAFKQVLVDRLLYHHRTVNGCDCGMVWGVGWPPVAAEAAS